MVYENEINLIKVQNGKDGIGEKGEDGKSLYTWVKYSQYADGTDLTDDPTDAIYIGIAYNKEEQSESNIKSDYTWSKIKGDKGEKGIPGADGTSSYFYIKYADSYETISNMYDTPKSTTQYMGVISTLNKTAPTNPNLYNWSLIKGSDGKDGSPGASGKDGKTSYLHIKYSNDGMTFTDNFGEDIGTYIGTYVDYIEQDSTIFNDYTWKKFVGEDGENGTDGTSSYTHIKYSANSSGNPMVDNPTDSTPYIGVYAGSSSTAPTSYTDYVWSRYKGQNGTNGTNGTDGISIISVTPIYYCTDNLINPPTTSTLPTEKVTTDNDTAYGTWNLRPATWTTSYKYYFICSQIEYSDGTIGFSSIVQDNSLSKCVAEIITNTNDIGLKVSKGGSIADINASVASGQSKVKISADAISLEGTVTANETFKINTDGSMEATGGKIGGLEIIDNGFRGSGFELEQAEILFDDDDTLPIIKKQSCLRLEGVTEQYGWNTTSKVEYSGNGVKSNYVDIAINKSAFDLEILPIRKVGRNSVDAKIKFHTLYYKGIEDATETISLDGSTGEVKGRVIKTYAGADLDTVNKKVNGSLKSTYFSHATGTSSAFPSVNISSIKDDTMMRIDIGIPIDNASPQTMAWFSTTVKKSTSATDYLYNVGGYYYSANYNASVFISVSNSRVTINNAWTKVIGGSNAAAVNNLKSKSSIYVYTENL